MGPGDPFSEDVASEFAVQPSLTSKWSIASGAIVGGILGIVVVAWGVGAALAVALLSGVGGLIGYALSSGVVERFDFGGAYRALIKRR